MHFSLSRLWPWSRRRVALPLKHLDFILYTRTGCHLCDAAWERLRLGRKRYGFNLQVIDVDSDPALCGRYGDEVPVVTVNGAVRFRGIVNEVLLDRLLRAEGARRS
jgi:glutaredoxin